MKSKGRGASLPLPQPLRACLGVASEQPSNPQTTTSQGAGLQTRRCHNQQACGTVVELCALALRRQLHSLATKAKGWECRRVTTAASTLAGDWCACWELRSVHWNNSAAAAQAGSIPSLCLESAKVRWTSRTGGAPSVTRKGGKLSASRLDRPCFPDQGKHSAQGLCHKGVGSRKLSQARAHKARRVGRQATVPHLEQMWCLRWLPRLSPLAGSILVQIREAVATVWAKYCL